jgi:hypothetical protein
MLHLLPWMIIQLANKDQLGFGVFQNIPGRFRSQRRVDGNRDMTAPVKEQLRENEAKQNKRYVIRKRETSLRQNQTATVPGFRRYYFFRMVLILHSHPNGQIGNDPPRTVLGANGNLRLGWIVERFNVPRHLFGFFHDILEGEVLNIFVPTPHWLDHESTVPKLFDIGIKVIKNGLVIFRHGRLIVEREIEIDR